MGTVYRAFDYFTEETVAVKIPRDDIDAQHRQVEREFAALTRVPHPNIVAAKSAFFNERIPHFSMEWVDGTPFDTWVRPDGTLVATRLRSTLRQVVDAIAALHAAGMVHCDLKPNNVLVTGEGRAVVLDLGLVAYTSASSGVVSCEAEVYGTPAYMAPEQAAGRQPTQASDIYALGVMLYQALTGQLPFGGSLTAVLWDRQRALPVAPSKLQPGVPSDLDTLCLELMALEPSRRPNDTQLLARLSAS